MIAWFRMAAMLTLAAGVVRADIVTDFEDLILPPNSYYNGSDLAGGFTSRGAYFNNDYNTTFGVWQGWSYSNVSNATTPGLGNQYAAWTGSGFGGAGNYGVAFCFFPGDAFINLPGSPVSVRITNTTYAALTMRNGDPFTNGPFGGLDGNRPDWFRLTISGYDAFGGANGGGNLVGSVDFYLADFRFADNSLDYILNDWALVDLTSLAGSLSLSFGLESSDVGTFGMNTPAYFALDQLTTIPEPGSLALTAIAGIAGSACLWRQRRNKPPQNGGAD